MLCNVTSPVETSSEPLECRKPTIKRRQDWRNLPPAKTCPDQTAASNSDSERPGRGSEKNTGKRMEVTRERGLESFGSMHRLRGSNGMTHER
jgi:hypothetical protein